MMMRWFTLLVFFVLVLPAQAADRGKVAFVQGELFINGKSAAKGSQVQEGDTLLTGSKSTVDVVMESGVRFRLYDKTRLLVPAESNTNSFQLLAGRLLSIVKKGRPYSVMGRTAVAGVRGTTFYVESGEDKRTYVCACEGKLHLQTPAGADKGELVGVHHTAVAFDEQDTTEEPMLGHTDDDIAQLNKRK